MKINDKHLVLFANSTAAVDHHGFLYKRGEVNKAFQKRWFVLKGNLLFYFDKKSDTEPIGVVILEGCSVEHVESTERFTFELVFLGSGARTYVLAADSQEEMESWMQALACSGHDYMKCAVQELQRQLDELNVSNAEKEAQLADVAAMRSKYSTLNSNIQKPLPTSSHLLRQSTPKRVNPFDGLKDAEAGASAMFYGGVASSTSTTASGREARTFAEMHRDFGENIERMAKKYEESKQKSF